MISIKTCSKCKEEKPFSEFYKGRDIYGLHIWCKDCCRKWSHNHYSSNKESIKEKHQEYRIKNIDRLRAKQREHDRDPEIKRKRLEYQRFNREHIREYHREYRKKNAEVIRERERKYYQNNKDKIKIWRDKYRSSHKEQIKESAKQYREENREKINKAHLDRLHSDPVYKMKEQTRNMLRHVFRENGHQKESRTAEILGCDLDFFYTYMLGTWKNNYGAEWDGEPYHIDHIIPLATAKDKGDIIRLCHYTNLQMLTPEDNMEKSDRI